MDAVQRRDFMTIGLAIAAGPAGAETDGWMASLRAGRCAVLWRHARTTPGIGDPPGFKLGDCGSQRNLGPDGRAQARAAGAWFAARDLKPAAVRSSAWCRCRETADLAFGSHAHWAPLDSTFGDVADSGDRRRLLMDALKSIPAGRFEVWVTHQVNIAAFVGESVAMGEAVIVGPQGRVLGRGSFN